MTAKAEVISRAELAKMNLKDRANWAGVLPKYMVMSTWTPRSERKKGKGSKATR